MSHDHEGGFDRRQTLKCMLWAGTGVVWTVAGGVPASRLIGSAKAAEGGFSFIQISDSHIGFAKPANPDARVTLDAAIDKIGHGAPGLERGIQGKPGLRPQQPVVDLCLDFLPDPIVLDIQKAGDKGLVVRQNLVKHTECVHATPSSDVERDLC